MKEYLKNLFRIFREPSLISNQLWRSDVILPITTWFNPRQKWLTRAIPNTWCDKDELILRLNFAILVDFVESEKGLNQLEIDWDDEISKGYVSREYVDDVKRIYTQLKEVYVYIKDERPKLDKQLADSYPDFPPTPGLSFRELYAESDRLDKLLEDRDNWALNKIIEYRNYLWT